jgi:preprotein translocase subunit SecY
VSSGALGALDVFSGGALRKFSVIAMGIMPYINASIIMQLLTVAIPQLQAMQKEGESGRQAASRRSRATPPSASASCSRWACTSCS